jgi:hypothetical protein
MTTVLVDKFGELRLQTVVSAMFGNVVIITDGIAIYYFNLEINFPAYRDFWNFFSFEDLGEL